MNYDQKALRTYIDSLFADAPHSKKTVEVKEEILHNLIDKYNDFLAEGKSEEAAYNISVASVGDISELIEELKGSQFTEEISAANEKGRRKSALLTSIAIAIYILCIVPVIALDGHGEKGIIFMFIMIAAATALLIYNHMTKSPFVNRDESLADDFMEWRHHNSEQQQMYKAISSVLWALTVVVYILLSFWTRAWHITWLVYVISGAINGVIRAIYDLKKS